MRTFILSASMLVLTGCATGTNRGRPSGPAKVNPASIAAAPATWNGRDVEVTGMLLWESERLGLYQSYGAYCRGSEKTAIAVDWRSWPGVTAADNRREVTVRGTFRNLDGVARADGAAVVANAGPGPGPLEPGSIVRWISPPEKPCPKALP